MPAATQPAAVQTVESQRSWRKSGKLALRCGLSAGLVALLAMRSDWSRLHAAWLTLNGWMWLAAVGLYLASQVASALRWSMLAQAAGFAGSRARYLQVYFEGVFFNLCLPSSIGGDVWKAYRIAPTLGERLLAGGTVLMDRAAGLSALLWIGTSALIFQRAGISTLGAVSASIGLLLVGAALLFGVVPILARLAQRPNASRLSRRLKRLTVYGERPSIVALAFALSLVVQGLNVATVVCLGHALQLNLPLGAYCVAVPLVALLTTLPVSIGGIGVREGALAWALAPYGLRAELGLALGLAWFATITASGLIGGAVYLLSGRLDRALAPRSAEPPQPDEVVLLHKSYTGTSQPVPERVSSGRAA